MFTRERIHLPSLESMQSNDDGTKLKFKRNFDSSFTVTTFHYKNNVTSSKTCYGIRDAVLWVDERNKDYIVVWAFHHTLVYHKKGQDRRWRVFRSSTNQSCVDMVFIESKLYVLIEDRSITSFDFSCGDYPKEYARFTSPDECYDTIRFRHLAVSLSGQVLGISSVWGDSINIYKMDVKSSEWSIIEYSLGDEAWLLDQRITVPAKDGVLQNCLYYSNGQFREDDNGICVVNIRSDHE